jgi:hypothetical protein
VTKETLFPTDIVCLATTIFESHPRLLGLVSCQSNSSVITGTGLVHDPIPPTTVIIAQMNGMEATWCVSLDIFYIANI